MRWLLVLALPKHQVHPPLHPSRRHVFLVGRDMPHVPERITDLSVAIPVEPIGRLAQRLSARRQCAFIYRVDVGDIQVQATGDLRSPSASGLTSPISGNSSATIVEPFAFDVGVSSAPVRHHQSQHLGCAKHLLIELDRRLRVPNVQIRGCPLVFLSKMVCCHHPINPNCFELGPLRHFRRVVHRVPGSLVKRARHLGAIAVSPSITSMSMDKPPTSEKRYEQVYGKSCSRP